jgi:hypothetical protein
MLHSRLGLQKYLTPDANDGSGQKRVRAETKSQPKRDEGMWKHVTVLRELISNNYPTPGARCRTCHPDLPRLERALVYSSELFRIQMLWLSF